MPVSAAKNFTFSGHVKQVNQKLCPIASHVAVEDAWIGQDTGLSPCEIPVKNVNPGYLETIKSACTSYGCFDLSLRVDFNLPGCPHFDSAFAPVYLKLQYHCESSSGATTSSPNIDFTTLGESVTTMQTKRASNPTLSRTSLTGTTGTTNVAHFFSTPMTEETTTNTTLCPTASNANTIVNPTS